MKRRGVSISNRRGLTMLELLLATAVTAMLALSLATVMTSVARSLTVSGETRSALQRAHAAYVRIRAYTDPARCLLQYEAGRGFAVWLNDDMPGNTVNLREVRVFWIDAQERTMKMERVEFPAQWPEPLQQSFDIVVSPGSDFLSIMEQQRGLGYTKTETVIDGLASAEMAHSAISIEDAERFRLAMHFDAGGGSTEEVLTAYAFLNHEEPR